MNVDATSGGGSTVLSKLAMFAAEDMIFVVTGEKWRWNDRIEGERRKMRKGRKNEIEEERKRKKIWKREREEAWEIGREKENEKGRKSCPTYVGVKVKEVSMSSGIKAKW